MCYLIDMTQGDAAMKPSEIDLDQFRSVLSGNEKKRGFHSEGCQLNSELKRSTPKKKKKLNYIRDEPLMCKLTRG
jgi:hypothetical protein